MHVFLQVWLALEILASDLQANLDAELGNAKLLLFNEVNIFFCLVNDKYYINVVYMHSEARLHFLYITTHLWKEEH